MRQQQQLEVRSKLTIPAIYIHAFILNANLGCWHKIEREALITEKQKLAAAVETAEMLRRKTSAIRRCADALEELRRSIVRFETTQRERDTERQRDTQRYAERFANNNANGGGDNRDSEALAGHLRNLIRRAERKCEL